MKTILIRIKKAGNRTSVFTISDNYGNTLATDITKEELIKGKAFSVEDNVSVIIVTYTGINCWDMSINIPITTITNLENASIVFEPIRTSSTWKHLTDPTLYNNFYGCVAPYIIEYPFSYQYQDEIVQNVIDYTKAFVYLPSITGVFDDNRKIQVDDRYFTTAILYNDQQSSGMLNLVANPQNNMKAYLSYPKYNSDSKDILYTKSDNFYQYNTFWNVVNSKTIPIFVTSCESMSIDKELNEDNMDYSTRSFRKQQIRAKDLKVRHILNESDVHLVSQFIITPSQISYK